MSTSCRLSPSEGDTDDDDERRAASAAPLPRRSRGRGSPQPVPDRVPDPHFEDEVFVMDNGDGTWGASWQGEMAVLGEFDGTEADAVAWARGRCSRVWVYSHELGDMTLMYPS